MARLAIPVYRALKEAGAAGLTRDELRQDAWLESGVSVGLVVVWLRGHGVQVSYHEGRFTLVSPLPDAWGQAIE